MGLRRNFEIEIGNGIGNLLPLLHALDPQNVLELIAPVFLQHASGQGFRPLIEDKNIALLGGKPLIAYTIETALACKNIDKVVVSTDSSEIARISKEYGADVPFLRPRHLAEDTTPDLPVFQHALRYLEENEGYRPDIIVTK